MKKGILLTVLILLLGGMLFADGFSVSGWGRGMFYPLWLEVPKEGDPVATSGLAGITTGGWGGVRFQIGASYAQKMGFEVILRPRNTLAVETEVANFWVHPIPWITLRFNKFYDGALVGKLNFTDLAMIVDNVDETGGWGGDDWRTCSDIFTEFVGNHLEGFLLSMTPPIPGIEGIYLGACVNAAIVDTWKPDRKAKDMYKSIHVGISYPFTIGTLRFGYIGPQPDATRLDGFGAQRFEMAFATSSAVPAYLHIPGSLLIDIGGKVWLADKEDNGRKYQDPYSIAVAARWEHENVFIQARYDIKFGRYTEYPNQKISSSPYWGTYLSGYYMLSRTIFLGLDFNFRVNSGETTTIFATGKDVVTKDGEYLTALAPWIRFAIVNCGMVKVGALFRLPSERSDSTMRPFEFAIPIIGEYWF